MGTYLAAQMPTGTEGASVRPLTDGLWFWSVLIAAVAWTLVQRFGDPAPAPHQPERAP
jgi:DHA1 family bicyclomycin/chloramphenicol resistance-like MFS transporter